MLSDQTVLKAKRFGILNCTADQSLHAAVRRMAQEDISALVVADTEGLLAGNLFRTDLIRALVSTEDWKKHLNHNPYRLSWLICRVNRYSTR